MKNIAIAARTICGLDELVSHQAAGVTHVLSIIDPGWPDLEAFAAYGAHHRTTLRFHDIIDADGVRVLPTREHVEAILRFGSEMGSSVQDGEAGHLLVHCHMGISRSTAAMVTLMAQGEPDEAEDALFSRLREIRPRAWPNSVMIGHADALLGRQGRLLAALRRHYAVRAGQDPAFSEWIKAEGRGREVEMAKEA